MDSSLSNNLIVTIKGLYDQLSKTTDSVAPLVFLQVFRGLFPQFAQQGHGGVFMQQDAEECYTQIIGQLRSLKVSEEAGALDNFLAINTVSTMTCDENPSEEASISREAHTKLSCHISQSKKNSLPLI
jgi:ubiquitin carboxyl-terminal hydrolase 14